MKKFVYCSYWHTWSRNLSRDYKNNLCFIELNLTPVNGFFSNRLDTVKLEVIRSHGTVNEDDIHTDELPVKVIAEMKKYLGEELTNRLLNHDYLSEVTVEQIKNSKSNGGGVPFENIKSGEYHYWN